MLEGDEVGLFFYCFNIFGVDLWIINFGGGNISCKIIEKDLLIGEEVEVMWVKGFGGDIGILICLGIVGLYMSCLCDLKNVYWGIEYEDEMVGLFYYCLYDFDSWALFIDMFLYGLLFFKYIDYLYFDVLIVVVVVEDSEVVIKEIWGDIMGWVFW